MKAAVAVAACGGDGASSNSSDNTGTKKKERTRTSNYVKCYENGVLFVICSCVKNANTGPICVCIW